MASKQQAWEQEALKETYWELVSKKEKFPENVYIPWKTKNIDGDTLAHIYATYAILPDSFSEWKLCSRRTGETVAEVAVRYNTLPESFDRYDMFPILFPGHSLSYVKKEFDNIPSLKNDIKVLSDEIERMDKEQLKLESVEKKLRQDLSDRIEKSVEQTSAELRTEREKKAEQTPVQLDAITELAVVGGVGLLGLMALFFSSKMEKKS